MEHILQRMRQLTLVVMVGRTDPQAYSTGIGAFAGGTTQGQEVVAIGRYAGNNTQGNNAIAIGSWAAQTNQINKQYCNFSDW